MNIGKPALLLFVIFALGMTSACTSTGGSAPVAGAGSTNLFSLDEALAGAVSAIEKELSPGTKIAIVKLDTPLTQFSNYLQDELTGLLIKNKNVQVLTRNEQLELVKNELNFQMSGYVDDDSFVGLGHLLGAQSVANGSFEDLGAFYQLRIRVIKVASDEAMQFAEVQVTDRFRVDKDDMIVSGLMGTMGQATVRIAEAAIQNYNRGGEYLLAGKHDLAIEEFNKALTSSPHFAAAHYDRAIAYSGKGEPDLAIADYAKAVAINPYYARAYSNRGAEYHRKGYHDLAIADFTKALEIDSYLGTAYYNRGIAYAAKEDNDRAIADYTSALRLTPNDASTYNNRGIAYNKQGDYDRAITDFTRAAGINPENESLYYNRGIAYASKGDHALAITDYTAALKINKNMTNAYYNRGLAHNIQKQYDLAIDDFSKVLEMTTDNVGAYYNRGRAYENKGNYDKALEDYTNALRINPHHSGILQALEEVKNTLGVK